MSDRFLNAYTYKKRKGPRKVTKKIALVLPNIYSEGQDKEIERFS